MSNLATLHLGHSGLGGHSDLILGLRLGMNLLHLHEFFQPLGLNGLASRDRIGRNWTLLIAKFDKLG